MKKLGLILALFTLGWPQGMAKPVNLVSMREAGNDLKIFRGQKYIWVVESHGGILEGSLEITEGSYTRVAVFDRSLKPVDSQEQPFCFPLSVNASGDVLALMKVEGRLDIDNTLFGKTAFCVAGKKELLVSTGLRDRENSSWLKNGQFYTGGSVYTITPDKVEVKKLGSFSGAINSDAEWRVFSSRREVENNMVSIGVELNNLKNNDVINIAELVAPNDGLTVCQFSRDGKYLYFRSKNGPAIYTLANGTTKIIESLNLKQPQYVGFYLDAPDYFYFHDFYGFIVLDPARSKVVKENPSIISPEVVEILSARGEEVFGVFRAKPNPGRGPAKLLFRYNWRKNMKTVRSLPENVIAVFMEGPKADVFHLEKTVLLASQMEVME